MSPLLNSKSVGFVLGICLIVNVVTLAVAIGSMNFQKQAYDEVCYYYGECFGFYIIIPAMALAFSSLGLMLGIIQIILFNRKIFTRYHFLYLNLVLTLLWILVIAIGWAPENVYFDSSIDDHGVGVTGWFVAVNSDYNTYQGASLYVKKQYSQSDVTQISFNMGLLIMSCIAFGVIGLITIGALIYCISVNSNLTANAAPPPIHSQQQWPGPTAYETKPPHLSANIQSEFNYGGQRPVAVYPGT